MFEVQKQQNTAFKMGMDISDSMDYTSTLIKELKIRKGSFIFRAPPGDRLGRWENVGLGEQMIQH